MDKNIIGTCCTNGSGLYSSTPAVVAITSLDLSYLDEETLFESTFGELRVYFDEDSWNSHELGLIYTDKQWLHDFQKLLMKQGFSERAVEDVCYSEAGMQGVNYVSLDVGDPFIIECDKFYNFVEGKKPKKIKISVSALDR